MPLRNIRREGYFKAIGTRTRKDCKIYPRPLPITALFQPPYNYTLGDRKALEKMQNEEDYQDT